MFATMTRYATRCFLVIGLLFAGVLIAVCGGEDTTGDSGDAAGAAAKTKSGTTYQRIQPLDRVYTLDEVVAAGFKRSKTYDSTGLEQATAAIYGFYGPDPYNRKEYEIRFYPGHSEAVQYGMPMAEQSIGENAKLTEEDAPWDAPLTEERECQGNVPGSHHAGKCLNAKYRDLVVYANMVILCQGREAAESQQTCEALINILK